MPDSPKALLVTTVSGFVPQFEMNNVTILQDMGYQVHYAANFNTPSYGNDNHRLDGTGIIRHQIDFVRSPFKASNLTVYRQLLDLMKSERFSLVHCHTPMGGVMARLAAHATKTGPVIYTAHGFHFFKGAKPINWLCYYPMEKFLSRYTDQQICINQEDYACAKKHFHARNVDYIPGAGFDAGRIPPMTSSEIQKKKQTLGLPLDRYILLSSGELIKRKNHETTIRAMALLKDQIPNFQYVICGHGQLHEYLQHLVAELNLEQHVTFLGYREDMLEIFQCADIFLFPSYQEGLPMAMLEAMASGLPIICSNIRGSRDLMESVEDKSFQAETATPHSLEMCKGGIMVSKPDQVESYASALTQLLSHPKQLYEMKQINVARAMLFSTSQVTKRMQKIYQRISCL